LVVLKVCAWVRGAHTQLLHLESFKPRRIGIVVLRGYAKFEIQNETYTTLAF
jgi:hypothetical protein